MSVSKSLTPNHNASACKPRAVQFAKKVLSISLGLVDFEEFDFEEFNLQKNCEINSATQKMLWAS